MKANILQSVLFVILVLINLQTIYGLKCFRCNQTEFYTKKCVFDSSYVIECKTGEICTFGRVEHVEGRPDMNGCELKEACDSDNKRGVPCYTCDTENCNQYSVQIVSISNRVEVDENGTVHQSTSEHVITDNKPSAQPVQFVTQFPIQQPENKPTLQPTAPTNQIPISQPFYPGFGFQQPFSPFPAAFPPYNPMFGFGGGYTPFGGWPSIFPPLYPKPNYIPNAFSKPFYPFFYIDPLIPSSHGPPLRPPNPSIQPFQPPFRPIGPPEIPDEVELAPPPPPEPPVIQTTQAPTPVQVPEKQETVTTRVDTGNSQSTSVQTSTEQTPTTSSSTTIPDSNPQPTEQQNAIVDNKITDSVTDLVQNPVNNPSISEIILGTNVNNSEKTKNDLNNRFDGVQIITSKPIKTNIIPVSNLAESKPNSNQKVTEISTHISNQNNDKSTIQTAIISNAISPTTTRPLQVPNVVSPSQNTIVTRTFQSTVDNDGTNAVKSVKISAGAADPGIIMISTSVSDATGIKFPVESDLDKSGQVNRPGTANGITFEQATQQASIDVSFAGLRSNSFK